MPISALERKILNCIQEDIPFTSQPFKVLSRQLGVGEREFLRKLRQLKKRGIIRRFSAGLNHKKLKFKSTLLGIRVPGKKINPVVKNIVDYPQVTHCYLREGKYNLWVVFLYKNGKLKQFLKELDKQVGQENILNFVTKRQFKLQTSLKI